VPKQRLTRHRPSKFFGGGAVSRVTLMCVMYVRITQTPPGEAPLDVREKWVGLVLPVVPGRPGPRRASTFGVLTGPTSLVGRLRAFLLGRFGSLDGYPVNTATAIHILGQHHPDAAAW
jgi:hypothetical protein